MKQKSSAMQLTARRLSGWQLPLHALEVSVPEFNFVRPHLRRHLILINDTLWQHVFRCQHLRLIRSLVIITILHLHTYIKHQLLNTTSLD